MTVPAPNPGVDDAARVLRTLELTVTKRLAGVLHGDIRGLLPGSGSELADTRAYEPGDDVRRIDWSASARSGTTQFRTTVEDRELTVYLIIDVSGSMEFGSVVTSKRQIGIAVASAFGFLAARGSNRVGGGIHAGESWMWCEPRSGRDAVRALLHHALVVKPLSRGSLEETLETVVRSTRRRGVVVVVSDFADDSAWGVPLRALGLTHDLVAVEVTDPREQDLIAAGVVVFEDPETGAQRTVDTSDPKVRAAFASARAARRADVARTIAESGGDLMVVAAGGAVVSPDGTGYDVTAGDDWLTQMVSWLTVRRARIARVGASR